MKGEYRSRISEIRKRLYSRTDKTVTSRNKPLRQEDFDVPDDWEKKESLSDHAVNETLNVYKNESDMKKKTPLINKLLLIATGFFILTGLYATLSFVGGNGVISSKNIEIVVSGPISIAAGDILSLQVDVRNENDVALELADLLIEYPIGTREAENLGKELKRERISLGDIQSGRSSENVIESVLFGEEGEKKTIKIEVEYRVSGSNAIFVAEREYQVEIVSSPISMEISSPTSISSGQEIEFVVKVAANSENTVNDVLLVAEYPFGFAYEGSSVEPSYDENIWALGDLKPGAVKTVRVRGVLIGQDEEERTFRFEAGIPSEFDEKIIGTPFLTHSSSLVIKRPFVSIDMAFNGSVSDEYVIPIGDKVRADISWRNNLPSKVSNVVIEVEFMGDILDRSTISSRDGFFRSSDETMVWDSRSVQEFAAIGSGEKGSVSFNFGSLKRNSISGVSFDPKIKLIANISADSFDDSGVPKKIVTTIEKTVDISSYVELSAHALHFSGPFLNNGPMPPKPNSETTYTIVWSVSNLLNDITGTEVTATLPTYMRWMGVIDSPNEDVTYNPVGGEITWRVGNVDGDVGYNSPSRKLYFQVALIPSTSQIGDVLNLTSASSLEAQDTHTDVRLSASAKAVNMRLTSDPQYINDYGLVSQ